MKKLAFDRPVLFSALSESFARQELFPKFMTYMENHKKSCSMKRCEKIQTCKILLESHNDALSAHEPILLLATAIAMTAVANGQAGELILRLDSMHRQLNEDALAAYHARTQTKGDRDG